MQSADAGVSAAGQAGEHLASDGKPLRSTCIADGEPADHRLNGNAVHHQRCWRKEHALGAASRAVEEVVTAGTISTGDAMHAQRTLSAQMVERGGDDRWVAKEH